jgi:hypothetical protein
MDCRQIDITKKEATKAWLAATMQADWHQPHPGLPTSLSHSAMNRLVNSLFAFSTISTTGSFVHYWGLARTSN